MLSITFDLPPAKEQELTERIAQRDAEGVRQIINDAWDTIQIRKTTSPIQLSPEEFRKQLDALAAFVDSVRPPDAGALPDEALTRESMYEGRDFARFTLESIVAVDPTTLAQGAS